MQAPFIFPKIMTGLDLSNLDGKLIKYSQFMAKNASTRSLQFIHVIPHYIIPESVDSSFQKVLSGNLQIDKWAQLQLDKMILPLKNSLKNVEIKTEVLEGSPLNQLLKHAEIQQPDLLIVGKKTISANSGIIARRIARKTKCAVCFVTEKANTELKQLLVPIDFSDTSIRALHAAIQLQKQLDNIHITALHVIEVPMVAYKINRNQVEIVARHKQEVENKFDELLKKHKIKKDNLKLITTINDVFDISGYIRKTAVEQDIDLIITGARGHSVFEDFIFGSTTEKLVTMEVDIPILVLR